MYKGAQNHKHMSTHNPLFVNFMTIELHALLAGTPNKPHTISDSIIFHQHLPSSPNHEHRFCERVSPSFVDAIEYLIYGLVRMNALPPQYRFVIDAHGWTLSRCFEKGSDFQLVYRHDQHHLTVLEKNAWVPTLLSAAKENDIDLPDALLSWRRIH